MSSSVADLLARLPGGAVAPASTSLGRLLPVPAPLRPLLPGGGLRQGSTVEAGAGLSAACVPAGRGVGEGRVGEGQAAGGCALLLALLAGASRAGSWCALVGAPGVGAAAAAEAGVELSRLALVPAPGAGWARVVAALLDGLDVVAVRPPEAGAPNALAADQRALSARARHHGAVLLSLGPWAGADVRLSVVSSAWEGLGDGHGRLRSRRVDVRAGGRGSAGGRPRAVDLWLPAADAPLAAVAPRPVAPGVPAEEAV